MNPQFKDRRHAGRELATAMKRYAGRSDVVVLGLPRGGVPVASEIARELRAPLDVFVIRKLGVPGHDELAMGAIAAGGVRVINWDTVTSFGVDDVALETVICREELELAQIEEIYRPLRRRLGLERRLVVLVDDGLATGSTLRAAIAAVREHRPARIVVGVPIASPTTYDALRRVADEVVCAVKPQQFDAVGAWYQDCSQTTDEDVRNLLDAAAQRAPLNEGPPFNQGRHAA